MLQYRLTTQIVAFYLIISVVTLVNLRSLVPNNHWSFDADDLQQQISVILHPQTELQQISMVMHHDTEVKRVAGENTPLSSPNGDALVGEDSEGDRVRAVVQHPDKQDNDSLQDKENALHDVQHQKHEQAVLVKSTDQETQPQEVPGLTSDGEAPELMGITPMSTRPLSMTDWPLSKMDELRMSKTQGAHVPVNHTIQPIDCPQCRSILAGAVDGKRILLLGHALEFAGADIWLLNFAHLLEHTGATVRFLFLCGKGPLLSEHQGLSYLFAQEDTKVVFQDFDIVFANTVTIETWYHFFEKVSQYLPRHDMGALLKKTFFWVHEYDPKAWNTPYFSKIVRKVGRVIFDSHASRAQWIDIIDNLEARSDVIWPGVSLQRIKHIQKASHFDPSHVTARSDRRRVLNIATTNDDDVVVLQVSTIVRSKGSHELIEAFNRMVNSLPKQVAEERGWFLVLLGKLFDKDIVELAQTVNDGFSNNTFRSRILIREPTIDVESYYAAADVAVLNSFCENFGMVLPEAMFATLPNIVRDCGGAPEIVAHGETGFLLRNTSDPVSELASMLRAATTGDNWREKLQEVGTELPLSPSKSSPTPDLLASSATPLRVEYYSLEENTWRNAPPLPDDAAESHAASTADERYIYSLSGQLGAQCNRPVEHSYVYDTKEEEWKAIPSLPVARYGACAALLNGRLHFVGGLDIDRRTPMQDDHYSLSLEELHSFLDRGTEAPAWKEEPVLPYGSGHVYCQVLSSSTNQEKLYYFGGETEDYSAKNATNGDFTCNVGKEYNNPFVFVYDGRHWERGSDMPFALSHTEGSSFKSSLTSSDTLFFGGSSLHENEIAGDIPVLSDGMYRFNAKNEEFQRIGSLYPIGLARKGTCGLSRLFMDPVGDQRLQVVVVGGQASESRSVPWAGPIDNFAMYCESTAAMSV